MVSLALRGYHDYQGASYGRREGCGCWERCGHPGACCGRREGCGC